MHLINYAQSAAATLLAVCLFLVFPIATLGQSDTDIESISLGIESQAKLGKWVPVTIKTQTGLQPKYYVVEALDAKATTVEYSGELNVIDSGQYQAFARLGRQHGKVIVTLLDADRNQIAQREIATTSATDLQPSTSKHLLLIGADATLADGCTKAMKAFHGDSDYSVIEASDAKLLPMNWIGYDGVDTVFLSTHNTDQLNSLSKQQWDALQEWVERGGRIVASANGTKSLLDEGQPLSRFLVGEFQGSTDLESLARLENFSKSRLETDEIVVAKLSVAEGKIELATEDLPLIIRQIKGMGQVVFAAFDLASPGMKDWDGSVAIITRLLKSGELEEITSKQDVKLAPGVGFTDLSGQLKIPLEQFSKVHLINFTVVAVLIGLYILCVGPGDFFMLKKFARKMELTWISFTLFTLAFCGLAFWLANWSRPQQRQINQLEIIDIDQATGRIRGNAWSNIFSPKTGEHQIDFSVGDVEGIEGQDYLISWLGTPGDGIGGMQAKAGLSVSQSSYETKLTPHSEGQTTATIDRFPLQVSSTRSLHTEWNGKFTNRIESNLEFKNSRLIGQITNPFPFELKNVRVIYGNYARVLSNTLPGNSTFDLGSETREWTVKSHMTRRTKSKDKKDRGQNLPWDPTSARLERIADMMMFYNVAGGISYTSLTHDYQNRIEMSDHILYDRALFVGEVELKTSQITIDGKTSEENYDKQLTVFRILLPVD